MKLTEKQSVALKYAYRRVDTTFIEPGSPCVHPFTLRSLLRKGLLRVCKCRMGLNAGVTGYTCTAKALSLLGY